MRHGKSGWAIAGLALIVAGHGSATAAEKRFGLTSFERIIVNADFIVEVTNNAPVSAVVIGTADALDRVSMVSSGGVLTISDRRFASDRKRGGGTGPVTIRVNAARLRGATLTGAGSLTIDQLTGARVDLGLRGPGALVVGKLTADRLTIAMIGNGSMTLTGVAKSAAINVSGVGLIDAAALKVTDLVSESEGSGDYRLTAVRSARITARGTGKTVVAGKAACTVNNFGSGTVRCGAGN